MRGGGSRRGGVGSPAVAQGRARETRVRLETHTEVKTRFQTAHEEIDCRRIRPWALRSRHALRGDFYYNRADSNEENWGCVRATIGLRGEA